MTQRVLDMAEPPLAGLRDRLLALRALGNLANVDDEALTLLAEHARYRVFRRGDIVGQPDRVPTAIQLVLDGSITMSRGGTTVFVAKSGDGLFVLPVVGGVPAGRAVADTITRTLEIPAPAFMAALEDNFSLLRNELRLLALSTVSTRGLLPVGSLPSALVEGAGEYPERPLTVVERVMRMKQGPFGVMSVDALSEFARTMTEIRVRAGEQIWAVGESSLYTLHLHYGRVRCTAPDGGNVDVESPTMLGGLEVWSGLNRPYEVRALTDVVAWRVALEDLLMVLESHVQPTMQMLANAARTLLNDPASLAIALGAHHEERASQPAKG